REVVMAFWADKLVTSLVTTHLPIAKVPRAITKESVAVSAYWLARLLEAVGARRPTIAVASLNPHAGEGGLLGREEIEQIAPGIAAARKRLGTDAVAASLVGPIGAETAMRRAAKGELAGVVAMYHDQATIPSKLLAFGDAVNVTLGLPIVRTSVDHGTGYDIAWRGKADEKGMVAAMDLAARLVTAKRPPVELSARSASSSRSSRRSGA
ncbi:MAG: 4-hydroxythreonine-4-phosphate dehydrogenase PdxA, partial [Spirochaetaceae bacterium]|nr:4-hydroxythreonine-4-phosphate dehydrogenase PdxA [Spirochaetaceae bacterium]